ncbi:unnamed protein product, partial [Mesorhabditis spiculigera]
MEIHTFQSGIVGSAILTHMLIQRNRPLNIPTTVLNLSASFNKTSPPFTVPYAMSKAALDKMTKTLAGELGRDGHRINGIAAGPTYESARLLFSCIFFAVTPIGRMVYPHEIGNIATFLCSEYASGINGETFIVDGGQSTVAFPQNFFHDVPNELWRTIKDKKASRKTWTRMNRQI